MIIPIGLEKLVYDDIYELSRLSRRPDSSPTLPSLFPFTGTIVTEIEALDILCGVKARLLASGGVAGAEGAIWLLLDGTQEALDRAFAQHHAITSEANMTLP